MSSAAEEFLQNPTDIGDYWGKVRLDVLHVTSLGEGGSESAETGVSFRGLIAAANGGPTRPPGAPYKRVQPPDWETIVDKDKSIGVLWPSCNGALNKPVALLVGTYRPDATLDVVTMPSADGEAPDARQGSALHNLATGAAVVAAAVVDAGIRALGPSATRSRMRVPNAALAGVDRADAIKLLLAELPDQGPADYDKEKAAMVRNINHGVAGDAQKHVRLMDVYVRNLQVWAVETGQTYLVSELYRAPPTDLDGLGEPDDADDGPKKKKRADLQAFLAKNSRFFVMKKMRESGGAWGRSYVRVFVLLGDGKSDAANLQTGQTGQPKGPGQQEQQGQQGQDDGTHWMWDPVWKYEYIGTDGKYHKWRGDENEINENKRDGFWEIRPKEARSMGWATGLVPDWSPYDRWWGPGQPPRYPDPFKTAVGSPGWQPKNPQKLQGDGQPQNPKKLRQQQRDAGWTSSWIIQGEGYDSDGNTWEMWQQKQQQKQQQQQQQQPPGQGQPGQQQQQPAASRRPVASPAAAAAAASRPKANVLGYNNPKAVVARPPAGGPLQPPGPPGPPGRPGQQRPEAVPKGLAYGARVFAQLFSEAVLPQAVLQATNVGYAAFIVSHFAPLVVAEMTAGHYGLLVAKKCLLYVEEEAAAFNLEMAVHMFKVLVSTVAHSSCLPINRVDLDHQLLTIVYEGEDPGAPEGLLSTVGSLLVGRAASGPKTNPLVPSATTRKFWNPFSKAVSKTPFVGLARDLSPLAAIVTLMSSCVSDGYFKYMFRDLVAAARAVAAAKATGGDGAAKAAKAAEAVAEAVRVLVDMITRNDGVATRFQLQKDQQVYALLDAERAKAEHAGVFDRSSLGRMIKDASVNVLTVVTQVLTLRVSRAMSNLRVMLSTLRRGQLGTGRLFRRIAMITALASHVLDQVPAAQRDAGITALMRMCRQFDGVFALSGIAPSSQRALLRLPAAAMRTAHGVGGASMPPPLYVYRAELSDGERAAEAAAIEAASAADADALKEIVDSPAQREEADRLLERLAATDAAMDEAVAALRTPPTVTGTESEFVENHGKRSTLRKIGESIAGALRGSVDAALRRGPASVGVVSASGAQWSAGPGDVVAARLAAMAKEIAPFAEALSVRLSVGKDASSGQVRAALRKLDEGDRDQGGAAADAVADLARCWEAADRRLAELAGLAAEAAGSTAADRRLAELAAAASAEQKELIAQRFFDLWCDLSLTGGKHQRLVGSFGIADVRKAVLSLAAGGGSDAKNKLGADLLAYVTKQHAAAAAAEASPGVAAAKLKAKTLADALVQAPATVYYAVDFIVDQTTLQRRLYETMYAELLMGFGKDKVASAAAMLSGRLPEFGEELARARAGDGRAPKDDPHLESDVMDALRKTDARGNALRVDVFVELLNAVTSVEIAAGGSFVVDTIKSGGASGPDPRLARSKALNMEHGLVVDAVNSPVIRRLIADSASGASGASGGDCVAKAGRLVLTQELDQCIEDSLFVGYAEAGVAVAVAEEDDGDLEYIDMPDDAKAMALPVVRLALDFRKKFRAAGAGPDTSVPDAAALNPAECLARITFSLGAPDGASPPADPSKSLTKITEITDISVGGGAVFGKPADADADAEADAEADADAEAEAEAEAEAADAGRNGRLEMKNERN